ncbi:sulfurtransferase [Algoriphagus boritolerans]|uniref:Thiosulfate/3-mercaptopyruvate sulfurtransferase n=1 Tax=Algoriphagus boritolerans DSM 17298 = JCM 18970 TaxID=1120964 RepID=A0A1H5ZJQ7_9BACT|nr:sulfurtransferase [Algoriphagus boritolerans]SEG36320.1 thiosulfate/3-mercaptopyruvate sulfurtransferase [Algoriphagus boritolerans DSM 17298 = JCM 18970]
MPTQYSPLIKPEELVKLIAYPELVIVDARNSPNPKATYSKGHLKGAIFVDPNLELADIKADLAEGGRHPLPEVQKFCQVLGKLGITAKSHVVVYDDQMGANSAARMWWMLRALGHEKVQVLEGGIQAAIAIGMPISTDWESKTPTEPYPSNDWQLMIADMKEVESIAWDKNHLIIDVRSAERYRGESEPIDLIAGHIPGAINVPLTENMDEKGNFLSPEKLREKYERILGEIPNEKIIVHCGSGVSACHTLLALDHAGLGIPKLYVGSWSEWSRNDKPIGKSKN